MKKRKMSFQQTYKKGVMAAGKTQINEMLRDAKEVYLINAGKNEDGTEFLTIKMDGIPSLYS